MKMLKKAYKESEQALELIFNTYFQDESKEFDMHDSVRLGLFEDMSRKVKSLIDLIENGNTSSLDTITRSLLESSAYLRLLISKENEIYARSYYLSIKLKEIDMLNKITANNKVGRKIRALMKRSEKEIREELELFNIEEELIKLRESYADVLMKRKDKDSWYNLDGKTKNFEQLCIKLDMVAEYELLYRLLSKEVHSLNVTDMFVVKEGSVLVKNSNDNQGLQIVLVNTLLLDGIEQIYNYYGLKEELKKFYTLLKVNYKYMKN